MRKQTYDRHLRTKQSEIGVGERVLTRNRTVRGRNKIQDKWASTVYKVVKRCGDVYDIELADGTGGLRTVNRAELQVCPKPRTDLPPVARRTRQPVRETRQQDLPGESESSSDEEDIQLTIGYPTTGPVYHPPASPRPRTPQPRRSQRSNKGQHPDPFNRPRSVLH